MVDGALGVAAREQRKRLRSIETELTDVRHRLDKLYNTVETTDMDLNDFKPRIRDLRERQDRLEYSAEEARAALTQRRKALDDVNTIAAYAKEMRDFLNESELTERRTFIESFVKDIVVTPDNVLLRYTVPLPDYCLTLGRASFSEALPSPVPSTIQIGGLPFTEDTTEPFSGISWTFFPGIKLSSGMGTE